MQTPVVAKSYKLRALVFAAVLLVSGMLVFTLLQEARSSEIEVDNIGNASGGSHVITADVLIPDGEHLPIVGVSAIIETNDEELTLKQGHVPVDLVERADCATPVTSCTSGQLVKDPSGATGITQIEFEGFFEESTGYGVPDNLVFHTGGAYGYTFADGGYGYNPVAGFGYGGILNGGTVHNTNFGYGYQDHTLVMRYEITMSPSAIGTGDYWFTFIVDTGSGIQVSLQSSAQSFSVSGSSAGGGGGGDGGGPGIDLVVDALEIDPPEGALEAWRAIITGERGQTIRINTGSDRVPRVDFTLDADVTDANVEVVVWPPGMPPPGVDPLPNGVNGAFFVQITIDVGGTEHTTQIYVNIPTGDMVALPSQAMGMKFSSWVFLEAVDLTLEDDTYEGSFSGSCCSTFAVAFDEEDPTVSLSVPESPLFGTVTLEADVDDNVQVDRVEFFVGASSIGTATSAPYTIDWDTTGVIDGDHTLRAVAYDAVDNSAEDSQGATVSQADDPTATPGGDPSGTSPWLWIFLILAAVVIIGGAIWYFQNQKKGGSS